MKSSSAVLWCCLIVVSLALVHGRPAFGGNGRKLKQTFATGLVLPDGPRLKNAAGIFGSSDCPQAWDWTSQGVVADVKNQGSCGSCWAFAAIGAMESVSAIATGSLATYSEKEIVDCVTDNSNGCDGGWYQPAWKWTADNGIVSEDTYPYEPSKADSCPIFDGPSFPINGYADIPGMGDEDALLKAVCNTPVAVAIHASGDFMNFAGGSVFAGSCSSSPSDLNHAVLVVGYGTDDNGQDYWKVRNSWGADWCEGGYIRMARGVNICGIANYASYPIASDNQGASAPEGCAAEYTVVSGDTIFNIAAANNVDPQDLMQVNPQIIDQDLIFPGDVINIPPCSAIPPVPVPSCDCGIQYTIQPGDTLWALSRSNKVTIGDITSCNPQITDINLIFAGDNLVIPQPCQG